MSSRTTKDIVSKFAKLPDQIDVAASAAELLAAPPERDVFGLKVVRDG